MRRNHVTATLLVLTSQTLTAETRKLHAPWVTCVEDGQKYVGSRTVRTPVVTSQDGRHRFLYDTQSGKVVEPHVLSLIGKQCDLDYKEILGFDPQNRVKIRLADAIDEEGKGTHCSTGTAAWLYDPVTHKALTTQQPSRHPN